MELIKGSIPHHIQKIVGNQGIFYMEFLKKDKRLHVIKKYNDGSESQILNPDYGKNTILRKGNFRLGVTKFLKGKKRTTDPNAYLIAYDMNKKGYRNILYNNIQKIVANKKAYEIKVIDTKHFRLGLISEGKKND
jgi:hypothetical protein